MKAWSGVSRRLLVSFGALVSFFAVATYLAITGMADIHHLVHHAQESEAAVRTALEAELAIDELPAGLPRLRNAVARLQERTSSPERRRALGDLLAAAERNEDGPSLHARTQQIRKDLESSIGRFEDHAAATEHATFRYMLIALIGATLFAIAVALYIGRSIARPIARLEAGAARIAQGDLDTRIDVNTTDEFGRLAAQFNAMTDALRANQEQLVRSEKLATIGRLAAGVAHEISNPLGVIIGYVRLLERKAEGGVADDLKVIADEALRCQEIVDDLLELSRPPREAAVPCPLRDLCEEVVERLKESDQLSGVTVSIEGDATAAGHPQKLRQVVFNLIKNAVEAAGAGGTVRIRLHADATGASVTVADSGPGVATPLRSRLFEPFFTTKASGTGLGLAVSQAIAQAYGGSIAFEAGPLAGATFKLNLPKT